MLARRQAGQCRSAGALLQRRRRRRIAFPLPARQHATDLDAHTTVSRLRDPPAAAAGTQVETVINRSAVATTPIR